MKREFSAGGVVSRKGRLLLIKVANLDGEKRWTFPKGHAEPGETSEETALREVQEETGWRCRIRGPLGAARYRFSRQGRPVDKRVRWFWMAPVKKTGKPDADEILKMGWFDRGKALAALSYPSDLKLFAEWEENIDG